MFNIKCKREKCVFNKNLNCTAKEIKVTKNTDCKTYQPSNEAEVGEIEKVGQPPIRKDISVTCDAKCLFNSSHECAANGITIQTCNNKSCPSCCTFTVK